MHSEMHNCKQRAALSKSHSFRGRDNSSNASLSIYWIKIFSINMITMGDYIDPVILIIMVDYIDSVIY